MSKEAMKLAIEAADELEWMLKSGYEQGREGPPRVHRLIGKIKALAQPAQQEPVADRENAIIRFALHQFMSNAYSHMNAAAQDKDSRYYTMGAVEKFAKDAKDAEALLSRLQFKAPKLAQQELDDGAMATWLESGAPESFRKVSLKDLKIALDYFAAPQAQPPEDLYARLASLSKSLERSGRIDQMDHPDAYSTILTAMNFFQKFQD